jgi:hypothetical protein
VRRDDLVIYAEDGLLEVEYPDYYPVRLSVSPRLAVINTGRESEIEDLLETYAGQVSDLLAEVVRLTAIAGIGMAGSLDRTTATATDLDYRGFLIEASRLEDEAHALQQRLQEAGPATEGRTFPPFTASRRLGYRRLLERIRAAVADTVPKGSAVLVVSRGDRELVKLEDREASHFPQDSDGGYLGHHPRDSEEAIARLEELRGAGADYLVLPSTAYWWLEHYTGFAEHLLDRYPVTDVGACSIYRLGSSREEVEREGAG